MSRLTKYIEGTACIDGHEFDGCCEVCETVDSCSQCPIGKIIDKLAHYEDLEEAGRLIELPCAIGDDVYKVPSKTNYKLNVLGGHEEHNKVYHQKVVAIEIKKDCWFMVGSTDAEYGTGRLFLDIDFGETWFLTKAEAEAKLAELKGGGGDE